MREQAIINLAWLLPRRLAYWAFIRVASAATVGEYEDQVVCELTVLEAMNRWRS